VEPNKPKKSARAVILASLFIAVIAFASVKVYKSFETVPIHQFIRSDLPMMDLRLQFTDLEGDPITPEHSVLLGEPAKAQTEPSPLPEGCTALIGGDTERAREITEKDRKMDPKCPKVASWYVQRHPIGFTLYFEDAQKLLTLMDENGGLKAFLESKFFQGVFHDPLYDANIRAEDLHLEGLEGAFIKKLLREALIAHGELHYDIIHEKKGFVFSFVRSECPLAGKVLPLVSRVLARSGYRLPMLKDPIFEMRIGLQRVFLTEFKDRVYLANGLEALLNVLESLGPRETPLPKTPLVLTTRAEAFVDKLLPVVVNKPAFHISLGVGLPPQNEGALYFDAGKLTQKLYPKIFKGVLAGIPHDAFAALTTSHRLPPNMSIEDWQELASKGPDANMSVDLKESGFSIIWDLSAGEDFISQLGVVIAKQTTPDEIETFRQYFADSDLTDDCAGGTVFLAATSETLLGRMKESCNGHSPSVLNWEKSKVATFDTGQFFMFMNPGVGMKMLFLAGGGGPEDSESDDSDSGASGSNELEPQWKKEYRLAREKMRQDADKVFGALPIFVYNGNSTKDGERVQLKGLTVEQGASR